MAESKEDREKREAAERKAAEEAEARRLEAARKPSEVQAREGVGAGSAPPIDAGTALAMIAQSLSGMAGAAQKQAALPALPETRQGGLFKVGDRLVNANGQEIRGAKSDRDGRLVGGELYDPRTGQVVREFAGDEENVG